MMRAIAILAVLMAACGPVQAQDAPWQDKFDLAACKMSPTGRAEYFILEPGFQSVLEDDDTRMQITVTNETRMVDGVLTRVVEEREWKNGKLYEVARNFFAICEQTKDVYYFGEEVDFYDDKGKVVKHDGAWLAGRNGSRAGLIMPGSPKPKMKYYQEVAPGVAMDRAEVVSLKETCRTPAGVFKNCLKVKESSPLARGAEYKYHAPGIGLVRDEDLRLVRYGFIKK